ncbi:MAG: DUF3800 domain-containing protein [Patescibacteria group bacterium]
MKLINYFIDELGSASPKATQSKLYILSGIMVASKAREQLKIRADQIKFKYWDRTDIIFHSREIGRKEGNFNILKDESTNKNFTRDLIRFLHQGGFHLFGVIVDKTKIPKNWNEKTLYKKTSEIIIKNFIFALLAQRNCRGRLIVESATAEKDFYYHKTAGHFLSNGFKKPKVDFRQVQNVLTEVSFVTKKNFDIEEQLADILAYGLRLRYEKRSESELSDYEKRLVKVVDKKLFSMPPGTGTEKKKFYSQIETLRVLP